MTAPYREGCEACMARRAADEGAVVEKRKPEPGVVVRVGAVVGVIAGVMMSIGLVCVLGPIAVIMWIGQILFTIMSIGEKKGSFGSPAEWVDNRSWSNLVMICAWAPFYWPVIGLRTLSKWIWKGEQK